MTEHSGTRMVEARDVTPGMVLVVHCDSDWIGAHDLRHRASEPWHEVTVLTVGISAAFWRAVLVDEDGEQQPMRCSPKTHLRVRVPVEVTG